MVPIVYCNGDSYSDENFHESLVGKTYANRIAEPHGAYVVNSAVKDSNNRRIIRTAVHDVIQHRKINPDVPFLALIQLSFEIRQDIWIEDPVDTWSSADSNFRTHKFSTEDDWRERLLSGKSIRSHNTHEQYEKFFTQYSQGRAYFYSPYAERANLLCDLIMLRQLLKNLNIDYVIFQGPRAEKLEQEYLIDFFKQQLEQDPGIVDLESFGFTDWCAENGFTPMDYLDRPQIGHYYSDAHTAFADQVLQPLLNRVTENWRIQDESL